MVYCWCYVLIWPPTMSSRWLHHALLESQSSSRWSGLRQFHHVSPLEVRSVYKINWSGFSFCLDCCLVMISTCAHDRWFSSVFHGVLMENLFSTHQYPSWHRGDTGGCSCCPFFSFFSKSSLPFCRADCVLLSPPWVASERLSSTNACASRVPTRWSWAAKAWKPGVFRPCTQKAKMIWWLLASTGTALL